MKKSSLYLILALSAVFAQLAAAETASTSPNTTSSSANFDGNYDGSFTGELRGKSYVKFLRVSIKGVTGTWRTAQSLAGNNCLAQPVQFTIDSASADELNFVAAYSKQLAGCSDYKIALKKVAADVFKGTLESEGVLHPLEIKKTAD